MSSSRQFIDIRGGKAHDKSTKFVQTCNLLSRYIKEKRGVGDLDLEIGGKLESIEAIVGAISARSRHLRYLEDHGCFAQKVLNEIPQLLHASTAVNSLRNTEPSAQPASGQTPIKEDTRSATQLTIFYSGKVLIFEDYPADNVREIVTFARKRSSQMSYGILPSNNVQESPNKVHSNKTASMMASNAPKGLQIGKGKRLMDETSKRDLNEESKLRSNEDMPSSSRADHEELSTQSEANGSDLPIARRSSLHRFLEKRKDRAVGRGPYAVQDEHVGASSSSPKSDHLFDLNQ